MGYRWHLLIPVEIRNEAEKEKLGKEYSNSKIIYDNIVKDQEEDGQTYFRPAIVEETTGTMIKMKIVISKSTDPESRKVSKSHTSKENYHE